VKFTEKLIVLDQQRSAKLVV